MSLYVLDTDILSLYWEGEPTVVAHVHQHLATELAITVITIEEQLSGWYRLLRQAKTPREISHAYTRLADNVQFLARWRALPYTEAAIARAGALVALKLNVAKMDLRIAAITLEHNAILVTRNVRDFQRVPGLSIENWAV